MSPERRVPGADAFSRFVFVRYCWNSDFSIGTVGLNPFRILVLASIFQPSVIYHGIAIVKYTAPEPPQPHNIIMHHNNATVNHVIIDNDATIIARDHSCFISRDYNCHTTYNIYSSLFALFALFALFTAK